MQTECMQHKMVQYWYLQVEQDNIKLSSNFSKISDLHTTSLAEGPCRLQAIGKEPRPLRGCSPGLPAVPRKHRD
jgi:hypothetical protein